MGWSYEEVEYWRDGLWVESLNVEYCIDISCLELVIFEKIRWYWGLFREKKCFCNNIVYSLVDVIMYNLIFI